jgi:hypothetical protein
LGGTGTCYFGCGTVYELSASGSMTVLYGFTGRNDGSGHVGGLVADSSGNLSGIAGGGYNGLGVAFKITPKGVNH